MHVAEFKIKGRAEIIAYRNPGRRIEMFDEKVVAPEDVVYREVRDNILLNQGRGEIISALAEGSSRIMARMAVGDRGALPSNPQVPKPPEKTREGLYHEVFRQDIQSRVTLKGPDEYSILSVGTFNAVDIPVTSFLDQAEPKLNEVALVLCDIITGRPLPRASVAAPATPDADELVFTHLPFNSVPFKAEEEVSVTVRYKIFVV